MNDVLYTIIILITFYSISYALKETSLLDKPRIWIIRQHPFFYQLFSCYFCVGFHSGWITYLIANPTINIRSMFLWAFASAGVSFLTSIFVERIQS